MGIWMYGREILVKNYNEERYVVGEEFRPNQCEEGDLCLQQRLDFSERNAVLYYSMRSIRRPYMLRLSARMFAYMNTAPIPSTFHQATSLEISKF